MAESLGGRCSLRIVSTILVALSCLTLLGSRADAQQATDKRPGWLLSSHSALRVQIVQGRISVVAQEALPTTQAAAQSSNGRQETLRVQMIGGTPTISYVLVDQESELTIDVQQGTDVRIKRRPRQADGPAAVEFRQPMRGPLTLQVNDGQQTQTVRADSLWHLLIIESELAGTHLAPLIEVLRPSLRLESTTRDMRSALFQVARTTAIPSRGEVARLVDQLNDPQFQRRQAADRALRSLGPGVGPHLLAIAPRTLTAEQRERIQAILDGLAGPANDTPERIAVWLATEPRVWVELLGDDDFERREVALAQLVRLTGRSAPFDPRASVETRQEQLRELRRQLASPRS